MTGTQRRTLDRRVASRACYEQEVLGGAIADDVELAAEVVGRHLAHTDPPAAALIAAEASRLRVDDETTRVPEAQLLAAMGPRQPGYRGQISLYDLFADQVTLLRGGPCDHLWAYDEDLVGLVDGAGPNLPAAERAALHRDPWAWNTAAAEALALVLRSGEIRRLGSIRLMAFEGVARFAAVVAEHDAAHLVSHLVLQSERRFDPDDPDRSIVAAFPRLRGLSVDEPALASALRDGAPDLRALVVRGTTDIHASLSVAAAVPSLRHLGLWYGALTTDDLDRIASSAVIERLASLELFTVNESTRFPFDAARRLEPFASLQRLGLPGHVVPEEVRQRFADRPGVDFVSHDRRERIAFDIETIGWAENMR